jgi:hypothetical protein
MKRSAIAALAVFYLGLGIHVGSDEAMAQGSNVVGIFGLGCVGTSCPSYWAVTEVGEIYESTDGGETWTLLVQFSAIPGLVCFGSASIGSTQGFTVGITASGDVWRVQYDDDEIFDALAYPGAVPATDVRCVRCRADDSWNLWCRVVTACGDVYSSTGLANWSYIGNVFGAGPSSIEHLDWGELKGEFKE